MTVGVVFCAWQSEDYLWRALKPWLDAAAERVPGQLNEHPIRICAVSVPFVGFPQEPLDNTVALLQEYETQGEIDKLITSETPMKETEARGLALKWLVEQGVDILWQVDSDEEYTVAEIDRTLAFVAARPGMAWFRGSLKNYVFDTKTHLVDPFCPPRIHRTKLASGHMAVGFIDDNNVFYANTEEQRRDTDFPSCQIPKSVQWVRHITWQDSPRSRAKCLYQWSRWGNCSFKWNETENRLEWAGEPVG